MKQINRKYAAAVAIISLGFLVAEASAASTGSPRHGQQTVDVSGGPAADTAPQSETHRPMHNMPMMNGMPMMHGQGMENMAKCKEMMGRRANAMSRGNMAMGHRSDMHTRMHGKMRQCMENMHSGGMGMGN